MDFDKSLVVPEFSVAFKEYDYNHYTKNPVQGNDKFTPLRNAVNVIPKAVVKIVGQSYIVTSPGIYYCGEKFNYLLDGVEFLEPGKYSFRHVCTFTKPAMAKRQEYPKNWVIESAGYKLAKVNFYSYLDPKYVGVVSDETLRILQSKFGTCIPVHLAKRPDDAGLAAPDYRKAINEQLDYLCGFKVAEVVKIEAEPKDESFRLGDRYIPFIHFYDSTGYVRTISPNSDWTKTFKEQIPGRNPSIGYFSQYIFPYHPAARTFDEPNNQVVMSFLDTQTNQFIYDMYLDHCMTMRIREAGRKWFVANVKNYNLREDARNVWEEAFFDQLTGYEYNIKLNAYFIEKGYMSFKCPYSYHIAKDIKWQETRADTYAVTNRHEMVPGYLIYFSYKNQKIVGYGGTASGFITCADDDKMTVLETAWCQRVVAWSYGKIVDQKYMSWALTDWLIGPFAEKIGMIFAEAPMVFAGKKNVSRETKASILAKLAGN